MINWIMAYLILGLFLFFGGLGVYASRNEDLETGVIVGLFIALVFLWPFTLFGALFYKDKNETR